jgi:hypothetical protein
MNPMTKRVHRDDSPFRARTGHTRRVDAPTSLPSDQLLRWATEAVNGTSVASIESLGRGGHRASGTFRLRIEGSHRTTTDVVLKVPVLGWISPRWVVTNARALQLAERHGLAAPRLIAADLDDLEAVLEAHQRAYKTGTAIDYRGSASGTVATLETFVPARADSPTDVSVARLREAGAALARVHAFSMEPQADLPHRPRPCAVDDRAAERRRGRMPTTHLLQEADERVRSHGVPEASSVLLHGDIWYGNMLWDGDRCVALIDWKTAGVGDPGVDLGNLRLGMARYGEDAPGHVLEGWEREAGRAAIAVPYWDAVAALNTPTVLDDAAATECRDTFLRTALDRLTE